MTRDNIHNPIFSSLQAEVVTKPDGRYLIYYSSERDTDAAGASAAASRAPTPAQAPWSPEGGPAEDVPDDDV